MAPRILDTNQLVNAWHRYRGGRPLEACTLADAREWGRRHAEEGDIVRPVVIEFLCKVKTDHERKLYEEFLRQFALADRGRVLPQDWDAAEDIARSIRKPRLPQTRGTTLKRFKERDLGDCLIAAICRRLGRDAKTDDQGFPKA